MPTIHDFQSPIATTDATIANGESLSPAIDLGGTSLIAIQMPAAWTAANLSLQVSHNGTDFADLYGKDGSEYVIAAAANRAIQLAPADLAGARWIKLRSGVTATPVNQSAARTLTLVSRAL